MRPVRLLVTLAVFLTRASARSGARLAERDVLSSSNWEEAKNLLPEEILAHYKRGEYRNTIVDLTRPGYLRFVMPPDFRAAPEANVYLERRFVPDFNRRFTVEPADAASAFIPLVGVDLDLLLSVHTDRIVGNDSTVSFGGLALQLPPTRARAHYVRCPVIVHQFPDSTLAISYQGQLLARYDAEGRLTAAPLSPRSRRRAVRRKATVALRAPSASPRTQKKPPRKTHSTTQPSGHL